MQVCRVYIICLSLFAISFAFEPAKANLEPLPHLRGDEQIPICVSVPYLGGRQSPGDQIGTTWYDLQAIGSFGQRIFVDSDGTAYMFWQWMDAGQTQRYIACNIRFPDGSYFGEIQVTPSWSGYVQVDGTKIYPEKPVIVYHSDSGMWLLIWEEQPVQIPYTYLWPYVAVTNGEDDIVVAAADPYSDYHYLVYTSDQGNIWTYIAGYDSSTTNSYFVRASRNPGSQKVVHVWTQAMDLGNVSQWCNDVWYQLSTDNGVTWGASINVTNYTPPYNMNLGDSVIWAFNCVNAVFDAGDDLHIVWGGHLAWKGLGDTLYGGDRAKVFHWEEASGIISTVNSQSIYYNEPDGWWLEPWASGVPYWHGGAAGNWRTICDEPQLIVDTTTNDLYCLWHGNDDSTDVSAGGFLNGELYGAYSSDGGLTWTDYVNLTNTRTPGAPAGECNDEDYMTAFPYMLNDTIYITYVEDKDAGAGVATPPEGELTENPVRCWVFWAGILRTGIEEYTALTPVTMTLQCLPNPFTKLTNISFGIGYPDRITHSSYGTGSAEGMELRILDATGRVVYDFPRITQYALRHTLSWPGTDQTGHLVPAGVYFVELSAGDKIITRKVVRLR